LEGLANRVAKLVYDGPILRQVPIYEFKCECGALLEELLSLDAEPPLCPVCGLKTKRRMSRFNTLRGAEAPPADQPPDGVADKPLGPTAINLGNSRNGRIVDCEIRGFDTGVRAEDASGISISRTRFRENRQAIVAKNSQLRLKDIDIA